MLDLQLLFSQSPFLDYGALSPTYDIYGTPYLPRLMNHGRSRGRKTGQARGCGGLSQNSICFLDVTGSCHTVPMATCTTSSQTKFLRGSGGAHKVSLLAEELLRGKPASSREVAPVCCPPGDGPTPLHRQAAKLDPWARPSMSTHD